MFHLLNNNNNSQVDSTTTREITLCNLATISKTKVNTTNKTSSRRLPNHNAARTKKRKIVRIDEFIKIRFSSKCHRVIRTTLRDLRLAMKIEVIIKELARSHLSRVEVLLMIRIAVL